MEVKFKVPGNPKGKQRPRICRINGRSVAYTQKQTVEYEKLIRASYAASSNVFFEKNIPLEMSIIALFSIPNCHTDGWHLKRPDSDNIIKIIMDALNGVCYHDDEQICRIYFEKKYADIPETKITIKETRL